jgi:hypothetical protein
MTGQSELTAMADNKNYSQQVGNISLFILNLTRAKKIFDKLALPEKYLCAARL